MKFQTVVLQGHHPETGHPGDHPDALMEGVDGEPPSVLALNQSMPIEVLMDFDTVLLFGKQLPGAPAVLAIGCTAEEAGFPRTDEGSAVLVRGYDVGMNPVLLRGKVLHSAMTRYEIGELELIPYKTQRQYVRYPLDPPADIYLLEDAVLNDPQPCQLINISISGACIVSDRSYAVGQALRLRIGLSPEDRYSFYRCEVVRAIPRKGSCFEYGLSFLEMEQEDRDSLMRTINTIQMETEKKFCSKS